MTDRATGPSPLGNDSFRHHLELIDQRTRLDQYPAALESAEATLVRERRAAAGTRPPTKESGSGKPPTAKGKRESEPSSTAGATETTSASALAGKAHGVPGGTADESSLPGDTFGVALSGGGIRSATFCLGVFRALARIHLVRRIDFLSTVSGGGYFGSFLGGLFVKRGDDEAGSSKSSAGPGSVPASSGTRSGVDDVESDLLNLHSGPVKWLRENGRYLSPNGSGDLLLAGAVLLRNWLSLVVVISTALVTVFSAAAWLRTALWLAPDSPIPFLVAPLRPVTLRQAIALEPIAAALALLVIAGAVPLIWAYWLTQLAGRRVQPATVFAVLVLLVVLGIGVRNGAWWGPLGLAEAGLTVLAWLAARFLPVSGSTASPTVTTMRNRLSRWLSCCVWTSVGLCVFAAADLGGRNLAGQVRRMGIPATLGAIGAAAVAAYGAVQKLLPILGALGQKPRLSLTPKLLIGLAGLVVGTSVVVALAALTYSRGQDAMGTLALYSSLLTLSFGLTLPFVNLSSQSTFYGQRLTRAYLGASNRRRYEGGASISETLPGDPIALADYTPFTYGGPLHLINVTLNETVSGASQIEQRDRKGLPMAVGPCGLSVGSRHHALWTAGHAGERIVPVPAVAAGGFRIFPGADEFTVDALGVGDWAGISGAAFTTGLGSRTSLSLSLLLGLANVRLGYWWDSGIRAARRATGQWAAAVAWMKHLPSTVLPVYAYLSNELLARFPGPSTRRWYLSDGGHFENTGVYELLRRRVPYILLCDAGCDPRSEFEDIANLVRKARIDFDAEIVFYSTDQLETLLPTGLRPYIGTLEDFRRAADVPAGGADAPAVKRPHAALAAVFYDDPERRKTRPDSVIVLLKPTVSGDEPFDIHDYRREHTEFPQESTTDQFFDEAQWESYRRLGEHVATRVFGFPDDDGSDGCWRPINLTPPPSSEWPGTPRGSGPLAATTGRAHAQQEH